MGSQLKRHTMNNSQLPRSPTHASNQPTKWSNVILVTESTCHAACCTEEMLYQKMSMLPLPPSRPRDPSNLLIGAQQDSRSESTTNHQPSSPEETWPRFNVLYACSQTPPPLPKHGPVWTTSLT